MESIDHADQPATLSVAVEQRQIGESKNVPVVEQSNEETKVQLSQEPVDTVSLASNVTSTSSSTTSVGGQPFKPRYSTKIISQSVNRNGEGLVFTLQTKSHLDSNNDENNSQWTVERTFDDFEQLHHVIASSISPGYGLIMCPLPDEPCLNAQLSLEKSRHQFGPNTRSLVNDEWLNERWYLQEYLRMLLNHPVFGQNNIWEQFLCHKQPPPNIKLRKSSNLLSKLSENIDQKSKISHKDCEEYFQKEKDWSSIYSNRIKQASDCFNNIVIARNSKSTFAQNFINAHLVNFLALEIAISISDKLIMLKKQFQIIAWKVSSRNPR